MCRLPAEMKRLMSEVGINIGDVVSHLGDLVDREYAGTVGIIVDKTHDADIGWMWCVQYHDENIWSRTQDLEVINEAR